MKCKFGFFSFTVLSAGIILVLVVLFISCSDSTSTKSTVPELTTAIVSTITSSFSICGGNISSDGGEAVTSYGVCWGTSQTPTVADNSTNDGAGKGNFTSKISGLTPETDYYVRAYATNSVGTAYGNVIPFTTFEPGKGTVEDIDGNLYQVVKIGNQWWMAENLKVTHYRNGESIPDVTDNTAWSNLGTGACCCYDNNSSHVTTYGHLYNWYAVDDSRSIAPEGWIVPTDSEWKELEMYLGMSQSDADAQDWRGTDEGNKMKEAGTTHWHSPNAGATNESGFSALPGGFRTSLNSVEMVFTTVFWSSIESSSSWAWFRSLRFDNSGIQRSSDSKKRGFSIRCVME